MRITELKKAKQESKTMKEFIQKFKGTVRESEYKRRLLVKEFKQEMNRVIRRKLMEAEYLSRNIK